MFYTYIYDYRIPAVLLYNYIAKITLIFFNLESMFW